MRRLHALISLPPGCTQFFFVFQLARCHFNEFSSALLRHIEAPKSQREPPRSIFNSASTHWCVKAQWGEHTLTDVCVHEWFSVNGH